MDRMKEHKYFVINDKDKIRNYQVKSVTDKDLEKIIPGTLMVLDTADGKLKVAGASDTITALNGWKFYIADNFGKSIYGNALAAIPAKEFFEGEITLKLNLVAGDALTIKAGAFVKAVATEVAVLVVTKANNNAALKEVSTKFTTYGAGYTLA